jgi:hypothetical protein
VLGSVEDERTFQLLIIFEEQVEEPAHNLPRLGGAYVYTRLLHREYILLPSIGKLQGFAMQGKSRRVLMYVAPNSL